MVYGFVRQSSGAIEFTSTPGEGMRVQLLLPVAPSDAANTMTEPPTPFPDFSKALVLLVEDDPLVRAVVRDQLIALGCQVLEAEKAGYALDRAIDVSISRLRKRLAVIGEDRNPIRTIYGAGYLFAATIQWD